MEAYGKEIAIEGMFTLRRVLSLANGRKTDTSFYHVLLGSRHFLWTLYKPSKNTVRVTTNGYPYPLSDEEEEVWEANEVGQFNYETLSEVFHYLLASLESKD